MDVLYLDLANVFNTYRLDAKTSQVGSARHQEEAAAMLPRETETASVRRHLLLRLDPRTERHPAGFCSGVNALLL